MKCTKNLMKLQRFDSGTRPKKSQGAKFCRFANTLFNWMVPSSGYGPNKIILVFSVC